MEILCISHYHWLLQLIIGIIVLSLFDLIVPPSKRLSKFFNCLSLKTLVRHSLILVHHSPSARLSRFIQQKCINCVSVLYKARENFIYTCKNIYLRVIHLIIHLQTSYFDSIVYKCKFYTNIIAKKVSELYNCSEIQFSLALYNRSV